MAAATEESSFSGLPDPSAATLELGPHPKNVFVTQLNQRDDENDNQATKDIPIVSESGGKLLETGVNTLQKTLVLKKEAELNRVDHDLSDMRQHFRQRMQDCDGKKIVLAEKQQSLKDRVAKFDKFIQENEAKRRRAIQRYQTESRLRGIKEKEEEQLRSYLELLRKKQMILSKRVQAYHKFELYLMAVIDILPPDYIKVSDNAIGGLIMRYNTLEVAFNRLQEEMSSVQEQIGQMREKEAKMKANHAREILSKNSQLAELHDASEKQKGSQERHEQQVAFVLQQLRDKSETFGMILRAIDNVSLKCMKKHDKAVDALSIDDKLERILHHLQDMNDVLSSVRQQQMQQQQQQQQQSSGADDK